MQRIMIIGCGGAGKSHLARKLHEITGLPLIHLDRYYWMPGWVEPSKAYWQEKMKELVQGDEWIMDGNYGGTMNIRISRADAIIFLDVPTFTCLSQALRRTIRHWGNTRPDMTAGCNERFSWSFLHYILNYRRTRRSDIMRKLDEVKASSKIYVPKNRLEINHMLAEFESDYLKTSI